MKKLILILAAVLFTIVGFAQPFVLTVDGFRSTENPTKDYIVVQVPDADKAALFQRAKNYFTKVYNSPQNVISESGADMISVLGAKQRATIVAGTGCDFTYKLICEFKDNRMKVTPIWVNLGGVNRSFSFGEFYRENGEVRYAKAKSQIEAIINGLTSGLESALKETAAPASEDW